jgi:solute:Na+ symporter, SSS family
MLSVFDRLVVVSFFVFLLGAGWYFRRYGQNTSQYFRAGGRMAWWLVGSSAFMAAFSAWTFTGAAGLAYDQGLVVLMIYWLGGLGFLFNWAFTAAWFRQTRVITSMEAIRARLGRGNEQFYTWLALPIGVTVAGIWLYGLAIFLSPVFGFDLQATILVCGIVVVLMAAAGGQWAIVATDFVQALMLIPIAIVAAVAAWFQMGGWAGLQGGLPAGHWDLTASDAVSFGKLWVVAMLLEKFFTQNALHGAGRYLAVRDGREARKAALLATILFAGGSILWFIPPLAARAMGVDLAALFPGLSKPSEAAYVAVAAQVLPAGLMGLMVTGIVSATLSSMDSGLNRNAGIFVRSVYVPLLRPKASDREQVLVGRISTLLFGCIVVLTALMYSTWKDLGVFNLMMGFSALLGIPYAVAATWCLFIKRVPDWAAWSTVLVGIGVGAVVGNAGKLFGRFVTEDSVWVGRLAWVDDHHFVSTALSGAILSSMWFFGVALAFGHTVSPKRRAEIEQFFATMRRPVEPTSGEAEEVNHRGTAGVGRMCLCYSAFILLLVLVPNDVSGRIAIVFCAAFIGLVGYGLSRSARRKPPAAPTMTRDVATHQTR